MTTHTTAPKARKLRRCSHQYANGTNAWHPASYLPEMYEQCGVCRETRYTPEYVAMKAQEVLQHVSVHHGLCSDVLATLDDNSVDSMITDPPSGTAFMGKEWDKDHGGRDEWIALRRGEFAQALRVLKPGAHAYVWAFPKTAHWTMIALEDAGFLIRDVMHHFYANGYPKSLDISKEIDAKLGAVRENPAIPKTDEALAFEGIGTGLKPSCEHWILVQKPREESFAETALHYGTGGIDIDATRVPYAPGAKVTGSSPLGRWPGNILLSHSLFCTPGKCTDDCPVKRFDAQTPGLSEMVNVLWPGEDADPADLFQLLYMPKPSREEREAGLENFTGKKREELTKRKAGSKGINNPRASQRGGGNIKNVHPTVKPVGLYLFLMKQITPRPRKDAPPPVTLDMYAGSLTAGVAAIKLGLRAILIEADIGNEGYIDIGTARMLHAAQEVTKGNIAA